VKAKIVTLILTLFVSLPAFVGSSAVSAHGNATGIVKERMDLMKGIGNAMKTLTRMFKGETEYDAEAVRKAANAINERAGEHIIKLFPDGSLHKPTEALPTIWQDWPTFEQYTADLATYSAVLAEVADNEPRSMHGQGMRPHEHMMGRGPMMGDTGNSPMRGGQHPMNDPDASREMPPMASFIRLSQTCNACHTRFRLKK